MIPTTLIHEKTQGALAQIERFAAQEAAKGMPFTYNGQTYHAQLSAVDRINLNGLATTAQLMPAGFQVEFTTGENVDLMMPKEDFIPMALQAGGYYSAIHFARRRVKDQILAGNPPADVLAAFHAELQSRINP